jgi:hypothetical protein
MTLIDFLTKAAPEMAKVKSVLEEVIRQYPDLAGSLQPIVDGLDNPVAPENLAALAAVIPAELLNIGRGQLDPRKHPGDVV